MKVIVAGSRTCNHQPTVERAIGQAFNKWMSDVEDWQKWYRPEIVSGGAHGVDFCGEAYAKKQGLKLTVIPALWDKYGKKAGILRNITMAEYADALIAVWDGKSRGTEHMIKTMEGMDKPVYVYRV